MSTNNVYGYMEKFRKLSFEFYQLPNLPVLLVKTFVDVHGSVCCVCVFKDKIIIVHYIFKSHQPTSCH